MSDLCPLIPKESKACSRQILVIGLTAIVLG